MPFGVMAQEAFQGLGPVAPATAGAGSNLKIRDLGLTGPEISPEMRNGAPTAPHMPLPRGHAAEQRSMRADSKPDFSKAPVGENFPGQKDVVQEPLPPSNLEVPEENFQD